MTKKKSNPDLPVEPVEELTELMHSTFRISDENDKKYRVWSAMEINEQRGISIEEALAMQQVTIDDFEKYKGTRLKG